MPSMAAAASSRRCRRCRVDRPITVFESVTDMVRHYGYEIVNKVLSIAEEAPDELVAEAVADAGLRIA